MMTNEELMNQISLGEDSSLELKQVFFSGQKIKGPEAPKLALELSAMANASGGVAVLGVDDTTREVVGIPLDRLDRTEDFVRQLLGDQIEPPLLADLHRITLPNADGEQVAVLRIDVPRSLWVHSSGGQYYYRIGSGKRRMTTEYLTQLMNARSQTRMVRYDERIVATAAFDDLDGELVRRFQPPNVEMPDAEFLAKLAMLGRDDQGVFRPTIAGVLLATSDPTRWIPNAFIQAVAYRGTEVSGGANYQLDAADIKGPLDRQVLDACRFVVRNMRVGASKTVGRKDHPQFDITAVFEALVNAVAHRDYSVYGSKIRLQIFEDRLELYSPGALTNTMTVDSMPLRQASRYEVITSLLAKVDVPRDADWAQWLKTDRRTFMDKRGEGVRLVLDRGGRGAAKPPEYRMIDEAELRLTLYRQDLAEQDDA